MILRSSIAFVMLACFSPLVGETSLALDAGAEPSGALNAPQPSLIHHEALGFALPPGFRATLYHQGFTNLRAFAVSSDNVVFAIRRNRLPWQAGIIAMRDDDGDGRVDRTREFGSVGGSSLAVRVDENGQEWLYASATTEIFRWPLIPGEIAPRGRRQRIAYGFLRNGREHPYKPMAFDDAGNMFVMVGAPSNACMEKRRTKGSLGLYPCPQLERQAGVWRFDADTRDQHQNSAEHYATGIRNMLAFGWSRQQDALFGVSHGRDFLNRYYPELFSPRDGAELPSEEFHRIDRGSNSGWPYTYYDHEVGERRIAPEYEPEGHPDRGRNRAEEGFYQDPLYGFPGHWAPMSMAFYEAEGFPEVYRHGAFIVFKGGWGRNPNPPQQGYRISFAPLADGELADAPIVFANGFEGVRPADFPGDIPFPASHLDGAMAPQGLAVGPDGAMYLGDARGWNIWRITYEGDETASVDLAAIASGEIVEAPLDRSELGLPEGGLVMARVSPGQKAYNLECAACHQRDGGGAPGFAPALKGSAILGGDAVSLAHYVLTGPAPSRQWSNVMEGYGEGPLTMQELQAVLSYARERFAAVPPVTDEEMAQAVQWYEETRD